MNTHYCIQINYVIQKMYTTAMQPVSYTHLDVYKRQVYMQITSHMLFAQQTVHWSVKASVLTATRILNK